MSVINKQAYGVGNPIFGVQQKPIIAEINPTNQRAELGTVWINKLTNDFWILTSVVAGVPNWSTPTNGAGIFAAITVNPGDITAVAGDIIATAGDIVATAGSVTAGTDVIAGVNVTSATGDITATVGDIISVAGNIVATLGDMTAGGDITATGNITANTGNIVATLGDIRALSGDYLGRNDSVSDAPAAMVLEKSRAGGIITTGDGLGILSFEGHDGVAFQPSAGIAAISTGTIGVGRMPTDMQFFTSPDAVSALQNRMTLSADGGLIINDPTTATTPYLILGTTRIYALPFGGAAPTAALAVNIGDVLIDTTSNSATTRMYIASAVNTWVNFTMSA